MTDAKLISAVQGGELPPALFGHREHLQLSFALLRRDGPEEGATAIIQTLRRFTTRWGIAHIFDEPLTHRWIARLKVAMAASPGVRTVDALIEAHPELNDRSDKPAIGG